MPAKRKKAKTKPGAVKRTPVSAISPDEQIVGAPLAGKVTAYDAKTKRMTVPLEEALSLGDSVRVKGRDTDLSQRVERLMVGRTAAQGALPGETVEIEVADRVKKGDAVYKVRGA